MGRTGVEPSSYRRAAVRVASVFLAAAVFASNAVADVLDVMTEELERSRRALIEQPTPIYYLSYEITSVESASASGAFGALTGWAENDARSLDIDLRVGSPAFDNTRELRSRGRSARNTRTNVRVPVEDEALRAALWYETDRKYKQALERFTMVRSDDQVSVDADDQSGDFAVEQPERASEEAAAIEVDRNAWEARVRRYTAPFAESPHVLSGSARIAADAETRWYVNTEGSAIRTSTVHYRISVSASTRADDGMVLPRTEQFFSLTPDGLPDDETVMAAVHGMVADLEALREAPLVEPYTGPAMLSGRASGVFFHEILGHRLEGHRQKGAMQGQTFRKMIGEQVLARPFSVVFDPTIDRLAGTDLGGAYRYDNQGVKARRVPVIVDGVLTGFLMGRTPIEGFPNSNGHGRKSTGFAPVARQSNLIVEVSETSTRAQLKAQLIAMAQAAAKPFGLLFDRIQGGYTSTGRTAPNAFNVTPTMVYRIYPDGTEELVRGADLIGTPLTAFSRIVAGGDDPEVFNGSCGAESGWIPVSAVSPSILVSQIEVQKKTTSQTRLPILAPPGDGTGTSREMGFRPPSAGSR